MKFENLRTDVNRWGWARSLFIRIMSGLKRHAGLHVCRVNLRPLVRQSAAPKPTTGITLRILQPDELLKAADDPELDMPPDFVRDALARGDVAFGAYEGERLVGYSWRTFTAAPYFDGLWARIGRPYQYIYKSFTRLSHRGRRIHVGITYFADTYLLERGYTTEVGFIDITNFASLGVAGFLGRRRIGYAGYVKWFGHFITFRTPAVKAIGAELFEPGRQGRGKTPSYVTRGTLILTSALLLPAPSFSPVSVSHRQHAAGRFSGARLPVARSEHGRCARPGGAPASISCR
jgi:hypothetical protein